MDGSPMRLRAYLRLLLTEPVPACEVVSLYLSLASLEHGINSFELIMCRASELLEKSRSMRSPYSEVMATRGTT